MLPAEPAVPVGNRSGRSSDHVDRLRLAVIASKGHAEPTERLARALLSAGHAGEAIQTLFEALSAKEVPVSLLHLLGDALYGAVLSGATGISPGIIAKTIRHPDVNRQLYSLQACEVLKEHLPRVFAAGGDSGWDEAARIVQTSPLPKEILDLIVTTITLTLVTDLPTEQLLTALRRRYLGAPKLDRNATRLACAIGQQARINRWAWLESPEETAVLTEIESAPWTEFAHLRWTMYRAVEEHPARPQPSAIRDVNLRGMLEAAHRSRRREATLQQEIPAIGSIADPVSRKVRAQYESDPSPRWLSLQRVQSPNEEGRPLREILIAGCGTGKQAIEAAMRYANPKQVTAIDLSRRSLSYAARMAEHYGVRHLNFRQADILDVAALGKRFDLIECVGVLHHMADPAAGLRALVDVLNPEGRILLGLYSRRARTAIEAARGWIADAGITGRTTADIRKVRKLIIDRPDSADRRVILSAWDFYSIPDTRDLLLHEQEHVFDLSDIPGLLAKAGVVFDGLMLTSHQRAAFAARCPGKAIDDLGAWDELERGDPQAFRNMYLFWCRR